jgi:hypothetical protein
VRRNILRDRHSGADVGAQFVDAPQVLPGLDVPEFPAVACATAPTASGGSCDCLTGKSGQPSGCPLSSLSFKKILLRA